MNDSREQPKQSHPTHGCDTGDNSGDSEHFSGQNKNQNNNAGDGRELPNKNRGKQSFASLFKDNRVLVEASLLKYIVPPVGELEIGFEEIESVEKAFGHCLVGYVMGPRPSSLVVLNFVKKWGGGNIKFLFKDNGWIKFQFPTELERDNVLNGGPYMISGRQLFLKKMPSCFLYSREDIVFLPSWVQIFGLPADCWTVPVLSKIASVVGTPIHTDLLTISKRRANYARVLVEFDAKKPRVWEYSVKLPTGKKTLIKIKYELDPKYCVSCNSLGHTEEMCGITTRKKNHSHQLNHGNTATGTTSIQRVEPEWSSSKDTVPVAPETVQQPTGHDTETGSLEKSNDMTHETYEVQSTAAGKIHEVTSSESTGRKSNAVPEYSSRNIDSTPAETIYAQHAIASLEETKNRGKAVKTNLPVYEEQQQVDFGDDDLLSCDDLDCPMPHDVDFDIESEDMDDLLSRVHTQDQEEWKTVSKKNGRIKNKKKIETYHSKADCGASSMETEYVVVDSTTKQPLKGEQPRIFKKKTAEARRPDTAFGG